MKSNSFLKTAGTVVSSAVVLTLIALCAVFSDYSLSENQKSTMNILLVICSCSIIYCFTVGEISRNFSQMDKLWSLLPIAYSWITALRGGMKTRLVVYALIVTAWGIRLTVNFARKGAYNIKFWTGVEDYRWAVVRAKPFFRNKFAWAAFDLLFISMYQNLLVLAICFPALACMESTKPFGAFDVIAAVFSVLFLVLETVSDEYQWKFYQKKIKLLSENGSLEKLPQPFNLGFNISGPWAYMRHPNYLGEQGIWISLYVFVIGAKIAQNAVFHWSFIGPLALVLLFMGSSALGEAISSKKYPRYMDYINSVFKYVPARKYKIDE